MYKIDKRAGDLSYNYYQNDHLYTPQKLIDKKGNVNWQAQYQAFGEATVITESVNNNLRFPGQYYDQESGLHQNYFRDYAPNLGRYIESDLIGLMGGSNVYLYALSSPTALFDTWGLDSCKEIYGPWVKVGEPERYGKEELSEIRFLNRSVTILRPATTPSGLGKYNFNYNQITHCILNRVMVFKQRLRQLFERDVHLKCKVEDCDPAEVREYNVYNQDIDTKYEDAGWEEESSIYRNQYSKDFYGYSSKSQCAKFIFNIINNPCNRGVPCITAVN